jgi:hypothetical protein
MSIIQGTSKAAGGAGYEIENSIRLDGTGDMSRSVGSNGNLREWSWSFWVKRSGLGTNGGLGFNIGGTYQSGTTRSTVRFYSSGNGTDDFYWFEYVGGVFKEDQWTDAQYRDPSAWYHILLVWDTDGGTTPRARRYINGIQVTELGSSPAAAANADSATNKSGTFQLFDQPGFAGREFEGYCAEMHFVDGSALEPTDFGEFNTDGVWIPKQVTGITYGSNGFYLDFADSSDLGKDVSGNSNDFTSSGLATTDQMLDTPTLNASTFNPLWAGAGLSDGNLVATATGNAYQWAISTFAVDDGGKYVCELQKSSGTFGYIGLYQMGNHSVTSGNNYGYFYNLGTGEIVKNGSVVTDLGTGAANSLMRLEYNSATDTLEFFDDGSSIYSATTGLTGQNSLHFGCAPYGSGTKITATFQGLSGTPTADFLELTSANLPTPSITDGSAHFQTSLWNGNSSTQTITQSGNSTFTPGVIWSKSRDALQEYVIFDQVRGTTKYIQTDNTGAEGTQSGVTAFNSDGFDLGSWAVSNGSGQTHVGWQWKANGAGSSNTDGSITSTVSNNSTAGFSIGTYTGIGTGPGDAPGTVGHGLGISPGMIIIKDLTAATEWYVWHQGMSNPAQSFIYLNTTGAAQTSTATWNNTAPTSSVFSIGWDTNINTYGNSHVFYAFAEIPGYSSIGSYEGNSSTDGTFVYTGFKPAFILTKNIDTADQWGIRDATRNPFNVTDKLLNPNAVTAETSAASGYIDILSNGFKPRSSDSNINTQTIIYMAFAKHPFGGDGVAPATAR